MLTRTNNIMKRLDDCLRDGEEAELVRAEVTEKQRSRDSREQNVLKECAMEKGQSRERESTLHTRMNETLERVGD